MEESIPPEFYNNKMIPELPCKDSHGNPDVIHNLELKIKRVNQYRFDQEFLLGKPKFPSNYYYVLCKSNDGVEEYFVSRDLATIVGLKQNRYPKINATVDESVTLYKIFVKELPPDYEEMDID